MDFQTALTALKAGQRVAREDWAGLNESLFLVQGSTFEVDRVPINYRPRIDKRNWDGSVGTWSPSNEDLFAEDWRIVE